VVPCLKLFGSLNKLRPNDVSVVMVAPIIWNSTVKEFKTKPSTKCCSFSYKLLGCNLIFYFVVLIVHLPEGLMDKVSKLTGVARSAIFDAPDVKSIYEVPIEFWKRHIDDLFVDMFQLRRTGCRIHKYKELVELYNNGMSNYQK
jgi:CTP synthase